MATLQEKVLLAADTKYRNRLSAAIVEYAFEVLHEDPAEVAGWPQRGSLAGRALVERDDVTEMFLLATASHDDVADRFVGAGNDSDGISDAVIRIAVDTVWNQLAGVYQA